MERENRRSRVCGSSRTREPSVPEFQKNRKEGTAESGFLKNMKERTAGSLFLRKLELENRRSRICRSIGTREPSVPEFEKNRKEGTAESGFLKNRNKRTAGPRLFPGNGEGSAVFLKEPAVIKRSVCSRKFPKVLGTKVQSSRTGFLGGCFQPPSGKGVYTRDDNRRF